MLPGSEGPQVIPAFSPDGKSIAFVSTLTRPSEGSGRSLMLKRIAVTGGAATTITEHIGAGLVSGGRRLCREVPQSTMWQVVKGGFQPRWRRDGRELYCTRYADAMLMAVPVTPGATIPFGAPVPLFTVPTNRRRPWLRRLCKR